VVVDGTPISVPAPRFSLLKSQFDAARNERHIVVSVDYHEHEAMTFRFRGDLVRWAIWDQLPTQTRGWYVGRCVAGRTGSKLFELDLTFRGNQSVPFQFAGMRFQVNENFAEFVELFPDYVGVGAFTTATALSLGLEKFNNACTKILLNNFSHCFIKLLAKRCVGESLDRIARRALHCDATLARQHQCGGETLRILFGGLGQIAGLAVAHNVGFGSARVVRHDDDAGRHQLDNADAKVLVPHRVNADRCGARCWCSSASDALSTN
jgi:hypothetical protein